MAPRKSATKRNRIIIGADYGTTHSGISICQTSDSRTSEQHIDVIHNWPACHTKISTKEKVPSEVAYLIEGLSWGALIRPEVSRYMWTKLELDRKPDGEAPRISREVVQAANGHKDPVDIIADFLMEVRKHTIVNLDQKFGKQLWRTLPITLVITVPAVWSDAAKDRTMQAFDKAGWNSLEFPQLKNTLIATEPEAAAIYTIRTLRGTAQNRDFKVGDGFIVCDMGGGTVDLIAYKVTKLKPIQIQEATVGNGAQCGGTFVDRRFLKFLELRLGTTDFMSLAGCRSEEVPYSSLAKRASLMLQNFQQTAKSGFSGDEDYTQELKGPLSNIELDEARGITDGEILLKAEDIRETFDSCVGKTFQLLAEQQARAQENNLDVKYVFLVGGFSESPYMYKRIKEFIEVKKDIQVIKPSYAWSAVVRGAAAKGLEDDKNSVVTQRKARRHYGTPCSQTFDMFQHEEHDAYFDSYDGSKRANNQMHWLIFKGQDMQVSKATHAKTSLTCKFWAGAPRKTTWKLVACETDEAPRGSRETDVKLVTKVKADFSDVPEKFFKKKTSKLGKVYCKLDATVNISLQSALEFYITVDGKKYGSLTTEYK